MSQSALESQKSHLVESKGLSFRRELNYGQLGVFILFHLASVGLLLQVSWAPRWLILALFMHQIRFFGVSVVLHRYFSHKAFRTSRIFQAILALIASLTLVRGPIRFASAHRYHHLHSDSTQDLHSPQHGFWWSYVGWLMSKEFNASTEARAKDLRKFPELVWLDRFYYLPSILLAMVFYR